MSKQRDEHANAQLWAQLPIDLPRARAILAIAEAAGCRLILCGQRLDIDIPPDLPQRLRDALGFYLFLNAKAVAKLIDAGDGA